jgi:DNA-binding transcriptional MocR family regulator
VCRRVRGTVLKGFTNISAARLPQLALAEFLESGGFEKHLRQLRVALWSSIDAVQQVLTLFPTGTRASPPEGGFVLWIQLPAGYDGHDMQQLAANIGINILPRCGVLAERSVQELHPAELRPSHRDPRARDQG